jgi:hypothetical protein
MKVYRKLKSITSPIVIHNENFQKMEVMQTFAIIHNEDLKKDESIANSRYF